MKHHLRVARPTNNPDEIIRFYKDGLGFKILSFFEDHDGFDGIILGHPHMDYHLEFTHQKGKKVPDASTKENLLVFYIPEKKELENLIGKMSQLGYHPVKSQNPYWDLNGKTFEDVDKYRVVLYHSIWK